MPKEWTPEEREAVAARTRAYHEAQRQLRGQMAAPSDPQPAGPDDPPLPPAEPDVPVPPAEPPPQPAAASEPEPEPEPITMAPLAHEGAGAPPVFADAAEPEPAETIEAPGDDDFVRFLMAQDDETRRLLTDIELRVIYETETKRAAEEKKAAARKGALARAQRHARIVAGLVPVEAAEAAARLEQLSRKVRWRVNMPEAGNSGRLTDVGVRIDGRLLPHGEWITGTQAQYESYREIEDRAHQGELDFQGKGKTSKLRQTAIRSLNYEGPRL